MTDITVTDPGLVLLVGASGSGKTTFAHRNFLDHEIVSLDVCRQLVCGDPDDQSATKEASDVAATLIEARLRRRLVTVVDATNVRKEDRQRWVDIASRTHTLVSAIVLDPGISHCHDAARKRARYNPKAIEQHHSLLRRDGRSLSKAFGIRQVHTLSDPATISASKVLRRRSFNDLRHVTGPFDIVGDIHGMTDELEALLAKLGWTLTWSGDGEARRATLCHPEGRKLVFVGDAVDRGPRSLDALRIMRAAVEDGVGYAVASNHDARISRWLRGSSVSEGGGIETTQAEFGGTSEAFRISMGEFLDALPAHYVFDGGRLAVAHAGLEEAMILGASKEMREFAVYGPKTPKDSEGNTTRIDWAADYRGKTAIVYGHTSFDDATWLNNTICIDTGCVYGGNLTALRWPERELAAVTAEQPYAALEKPLASRRDTRGFLELGIADVTGKKRIETSLAGRVTVDARQMEPALEVLSRFTIDPRHLVYLPPTMSPVTASAHPDYLEHPDQAFSYFLGNGIDKVVVQTKHMGSRAHILVCRDEKTARERFHTEDGHIGQVWSRHGRAFFNEAERREVLARVAAAADPLFDTLESDWLILDAEIMPWNTKASTLIRDQYAPTGKAAFIGSSLAREAIGRFSARGTTDVSELLARFDRHVENAASFDRVWRGYSWETPSLDDIRIAPFHVLASEGSVHVHTPHTTHMSWIASMIGSDPMMASTKCDIVDLNDSAETDAVTERWIADTSAGAEGIVVKPLAFTVRNGRDLVQPALKVRGRDYLRIIYGVDYTLPENLDRLRERAVKAKRARAVREYALGVEALERLVKREPLRRVHECVAAILALETDPSDPRL